jgi:hypothetical protein
MGFFPKIIRLGREAEHSPESSAEVMNDGAIPFTYHLKEDSIQILEVVVHKQV